MRRTIVRTITATTINSANVKFVQGKPHAEANEPLTVNGVINEEKALKEVRKAYGLTAQVTELKQVDAVYEISVDDFIKYATKVENPTPEQKEESGK